MQTCKKGFNVCPGPQTKEGKDGFKGIQKEVKKGAWERKKEPVSISETETDWSDWSWQLSLSGPRWGHSTKLNGSQFFSRSADKQMASLMGCTQPENLPADRSLSLFPCTGTVIRCLFLWMRVGIWVIGQNLRLKWYDFGLTNLKWDQKASWI